MLEALARDWTSKTRKPSEPKALCKPEPMPSAGRRVAQHVPSVPHVPPSLERYFPDGPPAAPRHSSPEHEIIRVRRAVARRRRFDQLLAVLESLDPGIALLPDPHASEPCSYPMTVVVLTMRARGEFNDGGTFASKRRIPPQEPQDLLHHQRSAHPGRRAESWIAAVRRRYERADARGGELTQQGLLHAVEAELRCYERAPSTPRDPAFFDWLDSEYEVRRTRELLATIRRAPRPCRGRKSDPAAIEAVRRLVARGYPKARLAGEFDIGLKTIDRWCETPNGVIGTLGP